MEHMIPSMSWEEAIKFCEDHECTECIVYQQDIDYRTKQEKQNLHFPCCFNLVTSELQEEFRRG